MKKRARQLSLKISFTDISNIYPGFNGAIRRVTRDEVTWLQFVVWFVRGHSRWYKS